MRYSADPHKAVLMFGIELRMSQSTYKNYE